MLLSKQAVAGEARAVWLRLSCSHHSVMSIMYNKLGGVSQDICRCIANSSILELYSLQGCQTAHAMTAWLVMHLSFSITCKPHVILGSRTRMQVHHNCKPPNSELYKLTILSPAARV